MTEQTRPQTKKERVFREHPLKFRIALACAAGWSSFGAFQMILVAIQIFTKSEVTTSTAIMALSFTIGGAVAAVLAFAWSDSVIARSLVGKEINPAEPSMITMDPPGTHVIPQNYT